MTPLPDLRRDRADAKLAGVCAALARSWNTDPLLVRLGFVVLALVTNGFAIFAYLALAVLIPERGAAAEPVRDLLPFTRSWPSQKLVAAVAGAALLLGLLSSGSGPGSLVMGLLVLALLRWGARGRRVPRPAVPLPQTEYERLATAWQQRTDNVRAGLPPDWAPEPAPADPDPYGLYGDPGAPRGVPHPARRRRSLRTWSGVAVALGLAWGALAAAQAAGVTVPVLAWPSATLAVLALALVAVARPARAGHGRPHGLVPAAVATAVVTGLVMGGGAGMVDAAAPATTGPVVAYTAATLPETQTFELGARTLDLSDVVVTSDRTARLTAELGTMRVVLPPTGNVVVHYTVDLGTARVADGESVSGADLAATWRRVPDPTAPTLTLLVAVKVGSLEVVSP